MQYSPNLILFDIFRVSPDQHNPQIANHIQNMVRVVIVGGGYAGINAAINLEKSLPKDSQIVLVEAKDYFYHNVGTVRAAVSKDFIKQVTIPYDKLFKKSENKVLQAY